MVFSAAAATWDKLSMQSEDHFINKIHLWAAFPSLVLFLSILPQEDSMLFTAPKWHVQPSSLPALELTMPIGFSPKRAVKFLGYQESWGVSENPQQLGAMKFSSTSEGRNLSHWLTFANAIHSSEQMGKLSPRVNFNSSPFLDMYLQCCFGTWPSSIFFLCLQKSKCKTRQSLTHFYF